MPVVVLPIIKGKRHGTGILQHEAGVSVAMVSRWAKRGKISLQLLPTGEKKIHASEFARVLPFLQAEQIATPKKPWWKF